MCGRVFMGAHALWTKCLRVQSKSTRGDKFLGMPFDEDNQPDMSEERAKTWIAQLKSEGMPI